MRKKREKYITAFVLLALYLSLLETLIPKPFPWMKIGLANIVIIVILEKFDEKMAFEVYLLRVIIQGIMLGTLFSYGFIVSLISGGVSIFSSIFLFKFRKYLSLVSISILSAFLHNFTQLIIVYFLMFRNISIESKGIYIFIQGFLFMGCISGLITGVICERLRLRRENI